MRSERDEELFYDSRVPEGEEPDDKPELKLTRQERRWGDTWSHEKRAAHWPFVCSGRRDPHLADAASVAMKERRIINW